MKIHIFASFSWMAGGRNPGSHEFWEQLKKVSSADLNNNLSVFSGFTTLPPEAYTKWSDNKRGEKRGVVKCCTEKDGTKWLSTEDENRSENNYAALMSTNWKSINIQVIQAWLLSYAYFSIINEILCKNFLCLFS